MPATMLIFDIETRHDTELMQTFGYQGKEGAFPPIIFHLPCAIAVGYITGDGVLTSVQSLLQDWTIFSSDPCALTEAFWVLVNRTPVLISFNGRSFDIPVLELCALRYGCAAPKHWQDNQQATRHRYSKSHLDLLDILGNFGASTKGLKLAHVVKLLGYAGKDGMDGSMVQEYWEAGKLEEIRAYNRLDIIRTYAVWLQWARISGRLLDHQYHAALAKSAPFLNQIRLEPHTMETLP